MHVQILLKIRCTVWCTLERFAYELKVNSALYGLTQLMLTVKPRHLPMHGHTRHIEAMRAVALWNL